MTIHDRPLVSMIAAVSADGYISAHRGVPWHLPRDKAHFRSLASGKWLLVGRTTYEEMDGWFTNHHPLVLTRNTAYRPQVGEAVASVEDALSKAAAANATELAVIGGGPTFSLGMPWAERLDITWVADNLGAGVPFPSISLAEWDIASQVHHPADAENAFAMTFTTYLRKKKCV